MDNTRTTSSLARANRRSRGLSSRGRVRPRRPVLSKVVDVVSNSNDALCTTIGSKSNDKYSAAVFSAFGESLANDSTDSQSPIPDFQFFTGKPFVEGLGHAFLMRNYRAGLAKWQTADPMGYPDGWNQLAYCNNGVTGAVDLWGCDEWKLYNSEDWWDPDPLEGIPQELKLRSSVEHMLEGIMNAMASASELGLLLRVQTSTQNGQMSIRQSEKVVTYDGDGTIKHEQWRSWTERYDTTTFTCECVCTPALRSATDMLANVGTLLSSYGRVFKVIKIGGRVIDATSDIGTDAGLVSLLGKKFEDHEVLFTFDLGTKVDYYRSAYYHHLRSYCKE